MRQTKGWQHSLRLQDGAGDCHGSLQACFCSLLSLNIFPCLPKTLLHGHCSPGTALRQGVCFCSVGPAGIVPVLPV